MKTHTAAGLYRLARFVQWVGVMIKKHLIQTLAAVAMVAALGACGSDDTGNTDDALSSAAQDAAVGTQSPNTGGSPGGSPGPSTDLDGGTSNQADAGNGASIDGGMTMRDSDTDLCAAVQCGVGTCSMTEGVATCNCPPHILGAACDQCAQGYAGRDCTSCASGYVKAEDGGCVLDECATVDCRNGGKCQWVPGRAPICQCPEKFEGASCESCAPGYTGAGCASCAVGYSASGGACVADVCFRVDCGANGRCVDKAGAAQCVCAQGYTGATCDTCITGWTMFRGVCSQRLPQTQALVTSWFDASKPSTLDTNQVLDVSEWRDLTADVDRIWPVNKSTRFPRYSPETRGVVYDADATVSYSGLIGMSPNFTAYFVMRWNQNAGRQTIWRMMDTIDEFDSGRFYIDNQTVHFEHRGAKETAVPDLVSANLWSNAGPTRMVIFKRLPFLNGTVHSISNGTTQVNINAKSAGFKRPQLVIMGYGTQDWMVPDYLHGTFHEIIVFNGALSAAEEKAVNDYLRVKWGL